MSYRGRGGGRDRRFDTKQRLRDKLQSQRSENSSGSSSFSEQSNHHDTERHPPELRGREIGLWYARKNKNKRENGEGPSEKRKVRLIPI